MERSDRTQCRTVTVPLEEEFVRKIEARNVKVFSCHEMQLAICFPICSFAGPVRNVVYGELRAI